MPHSFGIRYAERLFVVKPAGGDAPATAGGMDGGEAFSGGILVAVDAGRRAGELPVVDLGPAGAPTLAAAGLEPRALAGLFADPASWERLSPPDRSALRSLADAIRGELGSRDRGSAAMAGALAVQFLVRASRALSATAWEAPSGPWSAADAMRHIDLHYADRFSVDFFTDRCAMNAGDFSRRFRQVAGCPLFEYINRRRVARACVLLKSTGMRVIEVAEAVGYNNLSFFNRYFLRIVGLSPRAFRNSSR